MCYRLLVQIMAMEAWKSMVTSQVPCHPISIVEGIAREMSVIEWDWSGGGARCLLKTTRNSWRDIDSSPKPPLLTHWWPKP